MAEITEQGYIALRTSIVENWNMFALLDEEGDEVFTAILDEENWIHERDEERVQTAEDQLGRPYYEYFEFESNQKLVYEIKITGEDFNQLPVTVVTSQLKTENPLNDERMEGDEKFDVVSEEEFDAFTFENVNDELTITHQIDVPTLD